MKEADIIEQAKAEFDSDFSKKGYMESRTFDDEHRNLIISKLKINGGCRILDLGTGSGYLAFEIAQVRDE